MQIFYQVQLVQCVLTVFGVAQTIEGAWAIFTPNLTCYGSYEEGGRAVKMSEEEGRE